VLQALRTTRIGGIILDDFPTSHAHITSALSLWQWSAQDEWIPSCRLRSHLPTSRPALVRTRHREVPPGQRVAELVVLTGGRRRAQVIYTLWFGHPQLVQARIIGLRQRVAKASFLRVVGLSDVDAERSLCLAALSNFRRPAIAVPSTLLIGSSSRPSDRCWRLIRRLSVLVTFDILLEPQVECSQTTVLGFPR
jgi:hypothetical protein